MGSREHSDPQRCRDHAPQKGLEGVASRQHPGPRGGSALAIGRHLTGQPGTECLETTVPSVLPTNLHVGRAQRAAGPLLLVSPGGWKAMAEVIPRPFRSLLGLSCWAGTWAGPGAPAHGSCVRRASSPRGGWLPGRCPGDTSQEEAARPLLTCPHESWSHGPGSWHRQQTPPLMGSGAAGLEGLWTFGGPTSCPWVLAAAHTPQELPGPCRDTPVTGSSHPGAKAWRVEEDQAPQVSLPPPVPMRPTNQRWAPKGTLSNQLASVEQGSSCRAAEGQVLREQVKAS